MQIPRRFALSVVKVCMLSKQHNVCTAMKWSNHKLNAYCTQLCRVNVPVMSHFSDKNWYLHGEVVSMWRNIKFQLVDGQYVRFWFWNTQIVTWNIRYTPKSLPRNLHGSIGE